MFNTTPIRRRCSVSSLFLAASFAYAQTPAPLAPMAPDAHPSFDVATIKTSAADQMGCGFPSRGREFHAVNCSVVDLIRFAYGVQLKQIVDTPDWLDKLHYDITGVPDTAGQPSLAQRKSMLQKLLADRFKLAFRNEQRELSVYVLSVTKTAPKLTGGQARRSAWRRSHVDDVRWVRAGSKELLALSICFRASGSRL